ncbi:hypothetical protein J3R82DRAFT_11765 [Butyriboletus roseoflavus]|nr:hypothetical protein J3R82DRAFT_11765 [Butyriboletus roseoflavus]
MPGAQPLPHAIKDTSAKLVYDSAHPYEPDQPGDIRGPCPGLNTLASHGAFVVNGNHLTNLMSIGANTTADGQLTPRLSIHFNLELVYAANLAGDGMTTVESTSLQNSLRINDSIARNPTFWFDTPHYLTAYVEMSCPLAFVSNQTANMRLNVTLDSVRSFYEIHKYPEGFYRHQAPYDFVKVSIMFDNVFNLIRVPPGQNEGCSKSRGPWEQTGQLGSWAVPQPDF